MALPTSVLEADLGSGLGGPLGGHFWLTGTTAGRSSLEVPEEPLRSRSVASQDRLS